MYTCILYMSSKMNMTLVMVVSFQSCFVYYPFALAYRSGVFVTCSFQTPFHPTAHKGHRTTGCYWKERSFGEVWYSFSRGDGQKPFRNEKHYQVTICKGGHLTIPKRSQRIARYPNFQGSINATEIFEGKILRDFPENNSLSWWFQTFLIFTSTWGNDPILTSLFFTWVSTTTFS